MKRVIGQLTNQIDMDLIMMMKFMKKNKIILVGGSDVQGACVNQGEDIASNLREKILMQ